MRKHFLSAFITTCAVLCGIAQGVLGQTSSFLTPGVHSYTVPTGTTQISVDMRGAKGGNNNHWPSNTFASQGGWGGRVVCTMNVTPGQVLNIYVGGAGQDGVSSPGAGGFNGGGNGGASPTSYYGGGGGGGTDIRISPYGLTERLVVAGGGGGSGLNCGGIDQNKGGHGGGLTAQNGFNCGAATGGSGGTQVCCAAGGSGGGGAGALGVGGAAVTGSFTSGGGGGGYYGGGGGGTSWVGGGGGSSYADGGVCSNVTHTQGFNSTGNGSVYITPLLPGVGASPSSLVFSNIGISTTSPAQVFTLTGTLMTSSPVTVNTTNTKFQFSFNGTTWFSTPQTYANTIPGFTLPLYVRFSPDAIATFSGQITVTGGGLTVPATFNVSGNGVPNCTGTPTPGTASIMPFGGVSTTPITLSLTDFSTDGSLAFQWQSSPTGTGGWTNMAGATNITHTFTGLTATTYYRCVVTCAVTSSSAFSNVVSASPIASACTPDYLNSCSSGIPMYTSIFSLIGTAGTSISDPSTTCAGEEYYNNVGTHSVALYRGMTYTPTVNVTTTYFGNYGVQLFIDFNNDGVFNSATETVGGGQLFATANPTIPITIPSGITPGTYRMRLVGIYVSCCPGGYNYPSIPPCITTSGPNYGQTRDYAVTILAQPNCAAPAAQPTGLSFFSNTNSINGSFSPSVPASENYLVVMTTTSTPPTAPVDGTVYTPGTDALGGKIISAGPSTSFVATGLTDNTPFWFWVYSYMSTCVGTGPAYRSVSPLSGTISTQACAFAGPKTIGPGGDYPTIAAAVSMANTLGLGLNASLEILPSYTSETFPITINSLLCGSADRKLTIRPHSSNASMKTISGSVSGPLISLNGARHIIIDGRINSTGTTKMLTLSNTIASATSNTSAIQFINDASDNKVHFMTLRGSVQTTVGGVVYFGTTTGVTGSDRDTLDNCDITDAGTLPYNCIYSVGTTGKENSHNVISNCNISNYFIAFSQSCGMLLTTGNTDWSILNNRFYQTATRTFTSTGASHYGIFVTNTTSGNNFKIHNNIVGYSSNNGTGIYNLSAPGLCCINVRAINTSVGYITPSSIQGNVVTAMNFDGSSTILYGIQHLNGSADIGTVTGNTIGSGTTTGAITRIISSNGSICMRGISTQAAAPAVVNISNNTIGGITLQGSSTAVGAGLYGIEAISTAATTITNNTVGSASVANSIQTTVTTTGSPVIWGIYGSISNSTLVNPVIADNLVANISTPATGFSCRIAGIVFNSSASAQILRNTVRDLSSSSTYTANTTEMAISGIMYTGSTGTALISQNTVNALSLNNTTASTYNVTGILYTASLNGTISRNRIYDIRNASTSTSTTSPGRAIGIHLYAPSTSVNIINNMITLGVGAPATNAAYIGIEQGVNTTYTQRVYHNTIYIGGTSTSNMNTTCFDRSNFTGALNTAVTVDIRNNIFVNTRTGGSGSHYAIANNLNSSSSTAGWPAANCNYNILYSANSGTVGYYNGARTFDAWKTNSGNCDLNSFSSLPVFANLTTGDLHINMGSTPNDVESHCNIIPGITTDYDNDTRPGPAGSTLGGGAAPDIGADEFDGVANDNIGPAITYTNVTCGNNSNYVFTATLADPAGVATGSFAPRVYFRKNSGTYFSAPGTLTTGTAFNGVWTFTVTASTMGGLNMGDVVNFYVLAQDNNGFVSSNTAASLSASNVNSVSVHPTNATTYSVGLSGTYTVGSGGNYTTLTAAANDYNARCLGGPVTFMLISPTYASESTPILLSNTTWANSTNTLLIRPANGINATITSNAVSAAQIRLYQAKYVTIDGINNGSTSLTLNNTYTSNFTAGIQISSLSTGVSACRNITIRNLNIKGNAAPTTSLTFGIVAMSSSTLPQNTTGADNDTITIEGNNITQYYYGIYGQGTSTLPTGGNNDWVVRNNIIGPPTYNSTTNIGFYGMYFGNALNLNVSGNTVRNVGSLSSSSQAVGIYVTSGVNGYTIDSNNISGISSLSSSSSTSSNAGLYIGTTNINGSITRNKIMNISSQSTGTSSARGITLNIANSFCNVTVANNFVSDIKGYGTTTGITASPIGISMDGTNGFVRLYHNTISLNGTTGGASATNSACFYTNSGGNGVDFRNNILINRYNNAASGSDKGWAFYTTSSNTLFSELDNNNFYVDGTNVLAYTSADRVSLSALQTAYGRNANSRDINPTFVNATNDLHLTTAPANSPLATGTPIAIVPKDIDNNTRSTVNPVMGGHEVQFCVAISAGTVTPTTAAFCTSGTTTITATGATTGQSMQWKSSTDSVTWSNIAGATTATYVTPTITTTTYYRLVNKCSSTPVADSATTKVTINPLPAAIGGNLIVCMGGSTTLTNATAGGTWISGNAGVANINSSTGVVTPVSAGTSTITYQLTATGCQRTAVLTVNALPTVGAITAVNPTLCIGGTITLNATSATGTGGIVSYNWSGPNSFSTTTTTASTSLAASLPATGEYSLSVTYPGAGCTSARVVTDPDVVVNNVPTLGSITTSSTLLCSGATLTLNALSAVGGGSVVSYNWTGPNSFSTTTTGASTSLTTSTASSGEYSVSVTYVGSGCTSARVMTDPDVTVNVVPSITSLTASNAVVCIGTPLTLTASGTTGGGTVSSFNWSGPSYTASTSVPTSTFTTTSTAESGTYSVTATYPGVGCVSAAKTVAVTVNALPSVSSITPSSTVLCVGAPLNFTAAGASGTGSLTSYNWSGPNAYSATSSTPSTGFTSSSTAQGGSYSVSVTYAGAGCTSTAVASTPVAVNALPTVAGITPSTTELCTGNLLAFTAGVTSGTGSLTSYNWTGPNSFSTTTAVNTTSFTPATTAASGAYSVSVTYAGTGCTSSSVFTSPAVTVNTVPSITSVTTSTSNLCIGTALTLTANGASGTGSPSGFTWTGPNGFNQSTLANSVTFTPTTTAASGNYSVSVSYNGTGCSSAMAVTSSAVTVNALPTVAGISPSVSNLCIGSPLTFTAGGVTGGGTLTSYNWSGPNSFSTSTSSGSTNFVASTTAQSGNYSLSVTYPGTGCTSTSVVSTPVGVYAVPTVAGITPSSNKLCTGTALTLSAGTATGGTTLTSYNWTGPNGFSTTTSSDAVSLTPTSTAASGNYSLSVTYSGLGCSSASVQTSSAVTVNALPTITAVAATPGTRCVGEVLSLNASGTTGTGSLLSYNWTGPNGYATTSAGNTQSYTVPATTASGVYSATVTFEGTGCTSSMVSSAPVTVHPLPSVFGVTGGGSYCAGGTGVAIGLNGSQIGINYQLYVGSTATGSPLAGDGTVVSFGQQTTAGTYTVQGTNAVTGCKIGMTGSTFISITPTPNAYTVSGGGTYCENATGFHMYLSSSDVGIAYQLYVDGVAVGGLVTGDGNPIDFGTQTAPGTYTVKGNPGSSCETIMSGSGFIIMNPAPTVYNVSGGGTICQGDAGVHVNLSWSVLGVNYQLYRGATAVGTPVAGTTSALDMGLANVAGTYTVHAINATTGCASNMTGSAVVVVNPAPTAYTVTGGGTTCAGTGAIAVGLSGSDNNHTYQLYNGSTAIGTPVAGNGSAISFGSQNVSGIYSVSATNTITMCSGPMSGTVTVSINAAPVAYNITGGGQYCSGSAGLTVGVAASNVGIMYQLYNGASTVGSPIPGTGAAISFGTFTAAGTYSVIGTNILNGCTGAMTGTAPIIINTLPTVFNVTGGGAFCAGSGGTAVGLSFSSSNVNYQLYNGSTAVGAPVAGTGAAISFGSQTSSGVYTVRATNPTTSCNADMSGSATVTENPLPTQYAVTGGGDFCTGGTGVAVGVASSQSGVNYQLYNGVPTVGSPVAGTGGPVSFGLQGTAGTYTVLGTNTATGCSRAMTGTATVNANALPTVQVVNGGGTYCENGAGVAIGLNNSSTGINYQLYNGSTAMGSPVAGTGLPVSFGMQSVMGTYTVLATNPTTTCTSNMFGSASVIINPLPTAFNVTGTGSYCSGGAGLAVGLANSTIGVTYQLYNGIVPVGGPLLGTGSPLNFGMQTAGTYTVLGTNNATTCARAMSGNATITTNPLPTEFNVNGGGTYCQNGAGVAVGLVSSQPGISYQLYNGSTAMGSPVNGTGVAISFGAQTLAGTYTVLATNITTSCTKPMTASATVIMNPAPTVYNVTGGGSYCTGGTGVNIGLSGSTIGTAYQLYRGATLVGGQVAGTGTALDFGMHTVAGTYTVMATNGATTCTGAMSGNANVAINALPIAYNMTGGGGYCIGGTGVAVGLANSQTGVNYQLYRGATVVGTSVTGTGSSVSFGLQTVAGVYSVQAVNTTTGCTNAMSTTSTVVINSLPVVYNVTGGGGYCAGGAGSHIGLSSSDPGVDYQLYLGAAAIGAPMPGSGAGIDYGEVFVAGTYSVAAINTITGCAAPMSGSATVSINTPPSVFNVTGGGSYCSGGAGIAVGVNGSQTGVNYTLYNGTSVSGTPIAGTGGAISFGSQLFAGTYTVRATNATSGCVTNMTGSATVAINPLPSTFTVTGGGSYCPGAGGVDVGLSNSDIGVTYQLYQGTTAIGAPITGTGAPISMGIFTATGTYSAAATVVLTGCTSNMTGAATVSQYPLPDQYTVTGGGNYCSGGTGVALGLSGSQAGISYQLYNDATLVGTFAGTGSSLSFGLQTSTGTFSVVATNTSTGCTRNMAGSAVIVVNALPTVYLTTGGGNYCEGGSGYTVILNGSQTGIDYQLYRNGVAQPIIMSGTGTFLDFGLQTVAGFYTVRATNSVTGCVRDMAGSPEVIVHSLPTVFSVTGGGNYCAGGAGVEIGLSGSTTGVNYRLYNGSTPIGAEVAGNGSAITFGALPAAGVYTVQAAHAGTGCISNMTGTATVAINPIPAAYSITGGGGYCSGGNGVAIGLAGSATGINYQLFRNGVAVGSALSGTGGALDFGLKTATGVYTVKGTNGATSCINNMTGATTVSINPAPATYIVIGGGSYCAGGAGVEVGLDGSEAAVNYTLYNGTVVSGEVVAGTGDAISFGMRPAGMYSVVATNAATACSTDMVSSANVSVNPLPLSYVVTGGGAMCEGSAGVSISLSGSESNTSYELYNGATATGTTVVGTGSVISFGAQGVAGTYTVMATNMMTGCTNGMGGMATISVNPAPAQYAVTGGGTYCAGGAGITISLAGSESAIQYNLYKNGTATGVSVTGTGGVVSFAPQFTNGSYTVMAVNNATSCTRAMSGAATVSVNAAPAAYAVAGGGAYCAGGTGVSISLAGSATGVAYKLYKGATQVGSTMAGTGGSLGFGAQTAAGVYTVQAVSMANGCTTAMTGGATVIVNALPAAHAVTGGGSFCEGGAGVSVGLAASEAGVTYRLYKGATAVGSPVVGTGGSLSFGVINTAGVYTVNAMNNATTCTAAMAGTATVQVNTLPVAQTVIGGGNYCIGGTGVDVALSNSQVGVNYQLYNGSATVGGVMAGTGNVLSFGMQTANGVYSVSAVNASTACARSMNGTVSVSTSTLPSVYTITGGGNYCAGGAGVNISLSGSQAGVVYRIYRNGLQVGVENGTGAMLNLGNQTAAGVYTIVAENAASCTASMAGSATVVVNTLPTVYAVSAGGAYCAGGEGVSITLNGSQSGITYRLYNGATAVGSPVEGTGAILSLGAMTAGTYSVRATNAATSCMVAMAGTSTISQNALPNAYSMTGGGGYCEGGNGVIVGLSSSQAGYSYQLYKGTEAIGVPKTGTGGALSFGAQLAGNYTVVAMNNSTGCTKTMNGTTVVFTHDQPMAFDVNGGGSYCAGGNGLAVTLGGSQTGINYRLYRGTLAVSSLVPGTGSNINFGMQTTAGDYTVKATNATTGCTAVMTGSATISINALPQAFAITGGGSYCAGGTGVAVGLDGSTTNASYQLFMGTTSVSDVIAGTGSELDFGIYTGAGAYKVVATDNTTGCTTDMTGTASIAINALPAAYTLSSISTGYCQGGNGVQMTLDNSQTGVSYRLYNGSATSGSAVAGTTGSGISFGFRTAEGTYSVLATNNATGCASVMTGMPSVVINPLPTMYAINGGGSYCVGADGEAVGLVGSQVGITYQLYKGGVATSTAIEGTGTDVSFGTQAAGIYTVRALNAATGCRSNMTGSATIVANPLPATFSVTGGGQFCAGGEGVNVGLSNSAAGIQYQLYNGTAPTGVAVNGGGALSFGMQTEAGVYTVKAMNTATGCGANMTGSATVIMNTQPEEQAVIGGGALCVGGAGVTVGLSGSATGVSYRLFKGSAAIGSAVAGTGSGISFPALSTAGTYTVLATNTTTGCAKAMPGSATVIVNQLPAVFSVTGGGAYCAGGSGVAVALSGSETGVTYKLFQGSTMVGTVNGNGNIVTFGPQLTAGTYMVQATNNATGCARNMTGSVAVSITPAVIPVVIMASAAGDEVCAGTMVTYTTSATNGGTAPAYQWKVNGTNVGTGSSAYSYMPNNGDIVSVEMTSNANCATPATATASRTMTVNAKQTPAVTATAATTGTLCEGNPVTFTANAMFGGDAPVFEWIKNGSVSATGASFTFVPVNGDEIAVRLTSNFACLTVGLVSSASQTLTVQALIAPTVVITANPGTKIAKGQSLTLTAVTSNTFQPTYQWYVNGAAVHNATSTKFTSSDFNDQDTVTCRVANSTPCGEFAAFNTVLINVESVGVSTVPSSAFDVRVMPNPNKGNFAITGTINGMTNETVTIEIANMLGQVVYKAQADVRGGKIDTRVDLGGSLANGMYLLNLHTENDSKIFHITLQQ